MQHICKDADGLAQKKRGRVGEREKSVRKRGKRRRKIVRIEWNNPHEFYSTSAGLKREKNRRDCVEEEKVANSKTFELLLSPTRPRSGIKGVVRYTPISKYSTFCVLSSGTRIVRQSWKGNGAHETDVSPRCRKWRNQCAPFSFHIRNINSLPAIFLPILFSIIQNSLKFLMFFLKLFQLNIK